MYTVFSKMFTERERERDIYIYVYIYIHIYASMDYCRAFLLFLWFALPVFGGGGGGWGG